jgi:hypothetical protein
MREMPPSGQMVSLTCEMGPMGWAQNQTNKEASSSGGKPGGKARREALGTVSQGFVILVRPFARCVVAMRHGSWVLCERHVRRTRTHLHGVGEGYLRMRLPSAVPGTNWRTWSVLRTCTARNAQPTARNMQQTARNAQRAADHMHPATVVRRRALLTPRTRQ